MSGSFRAVFFFIVFGLLINFLIDTGDRYDVKLEPGNIFLLWAYGSDTSVDYAAQTFT